MPDSFFDNIRNNGGSSNIEDTRQSDLEAIPKAGGLYYYLAELSKTMEATKPEEGKSSSKEHRKAVSDFNKTFEELKKIDPDFRFHPEALARDMIMKEYYKYAEEEENKKRK